MNTARTGSRLGGALLGALVLLFVSLGILAGSARAADSVYWADLERGKIFRADLAGGAPVEVPIPNAGQVAVGGVAVDPAGGKLYWTEIGAQGSAIMVANLDGSGAQPLNTAGSVVDSPIAPGVDPRGGRIYWANVANVGVEEGEEEPPNTIAYANLNGSGGGVLDTTGTGVGIPQGVAVDPAAGRVYWADLEGGKISFARLAGGGGGALGFDASAVGGPVGVAIDAAAQKVYWGGAETDKIGVAGLAGGAATELSIAGIDQPLGLALDSAANRLYWGQPGPPALMFANPLDGSGVGALDLSVLGADGGVFFPVLFKAPVSAAAATLSGRPANGSTLTCAAAWLPDAPEAQLYRAAQTVSYQWLRDGKAVAGATGPTFPGAQVGSYACRAVATNGAGSTTSATSNAVTVRATLRLKRARLNQKKGTATLTLSVDGAGAIVAAGKGVLKAKKLAARAGTYRLTVRATGKAKRKLRATGRARVRVQVAFTPLGGKALKQTKTIVLEQR